MLCSKSHRSELGLGSSGAVYSLSEGRILCRHWADFAFCCCFFFAVNFFVISTSASDCLERLVSEVSCYVQWDVKPYSLTDSLDAVILAAVGLAK